MKIELTYIEGVELLTTYRGILKRAEQIYTSKEWLEDATESDMKICKNLLLMYQSIIQKIDKALDHNQK